MGRPGFVSWSWLLFLSLSRVDRAEAEPRFTVVVPAVMEAGAEATFCCSLLQLSESLTVTVALVSPTGKTVLNQQTHSSEAHSCSQFEAPQVEGETVQDFEVEVRGDTFYSKQTMKVQIRSYKPKTFIQTDKPMYLPGQTVHFRVITLDSRLRPAVGSYDVIEIEDSSNNRIAQWLDASSDGKILQLSYDLNPEARGGHYRVSVSTNGSKVTHWFKVEKYVLPKFSVKITSQNEVSVAQEEISFDVCGKYTFGQSVPGTVEAKLCRNPESYRYNHKLKTSPVCLTETKQTGKDGCAPFTFDLSAFTVRSKWLLDHLVLSVELEEEGTGIVYPEERRIPFSYQIGNVTFVDPPELYELGSMVSLKVKAVHYNGTPVSDSPVHFLTSSDEPLQTLKTDSDGYATFTLNTTRFSGFIYLKASLTPDNEQTYRNPHFLWASHRLSEVQPPSLNTKTVSSVEVKGKATALVCGSEEDFSVRFTVVGENPGPAHVMWLVLSRGAIVKQGHETVQIKSGSVTEGEVSFKMEVTPEMTPALQVVTYAVLPSDNVIANSADFNTEKCFSHKVSLEFSPSSAVPGEDNTLKVTALPDSLCGISAVDRSVLLKEPGKTLNEDTILSLLPVQKASSFPDHVEDSLECLNVRNRRFSFPDIYPPNPYEQKDDVYKVFKRRGLKVATNLFIRLPPCVNFRGTQYHQHFPHYRLDTRTRLGGIPMAQGSFPGPGPTQTVRTFFPETWIWDLVEVGGSGSVDVPLTVPDTITTWETEAFCLSPRLGFGLAPRETITVFQPFFLELTLPYSVVRGEHFQLKATVFNYLSSCIMVEVRAAPSLDFTLTPVSGDQYTACLCGNQRRTVSWTLVPSVLGLVNVSVSAEAITSDASCDNEIISVPSRGRIDVVTKPLRVKAEGTEMSKTYNWLLCPKGEALKEEVELQLPENVIPGSARASVSALGDILGRAMKNLDGLLKMPYGCGEQNMALLAPNIYILQYLKNTQQLSPAVTEKASRFLSSGYQRQLNYKHSNGAYSTFGRGTGNTWLTAFVVRSFAKAQSFVYIDPEKMEQSKTWLQGKQNEDGCFQQSGKLFNNRMKGGVSDEVTLSAYITAAFLEMNASATQDPIVENSLSCLRESTKTLNNTYTTALLAYVFTLAGDMETRARLFEYLDSVAQEEGGFRHWSRSDSSDSSDSLSVEIGSYVLLAKLGVAPGAEELGYAAKIVRWLTTQQNPYGGFRSTQDTVVALQALALYSTLVFSPDGSSSVRVRTPSGSSLSFHLDQTNKLLYQEQALPQVTGQYGLEVTGSSCASVQVSLLYNVPTPTVVNTLKVDVRAEMDCDSQRPALNLNLTSQYFGKESSTNMVILDVKVLSGFVPDPNSVRHMMIEPLVERIEHKQDHVMIYIRELEQDQTVSLVLKFVQELEVQNLKPAVVKIYDYYQPGDQAETEYSSPCAAATDQKRK